jgi:hypothetical protein
VALSTYPHSDPFLHHQDGTHRSTAPNTHGRELAAFEEQYEL